MLQQRSKKIYKPFFLGWQPRWFVLDGGTLSYYDSQEDAWKGCKGSIKISVCEIQGWYMAHCVLSTVFHCARNFLLTSGFSPDKHVSLFAPGFLSSFL